MQSNQALLVGRSDLRAEIPVFEVVKVENETGVDVVPGQA